MTSAVSVPVRKVQITAGEGSLFTAVTTTTDTMPAKARKPRVMNKTGRMNQDRNNPRHRNAAPGTSPCNPSNLPFRMTNLVLDKGQAR